MENVVCSIETGQVTGVNREPLAFEKEIKVENALSFTKLVETGTQKVQKKDEHGNPLYMTNIVTDEEGNLVSFEETTEAIEVLETTTRQVLNKWKDNNGTLNEEWVTVEEPTKTQERNPVLIDSPIYTSIKFEDSFASFTYEDIVEAKKAQINAVRLGTLVFFDEDLPEEHFSTNLATHLADRGVGFVSLPENGQIRTVKIPLGKATDRIEIYAEVDKGITIEVGATASSFVPVDKRIALLDAPTSEVYIRFTNTAQARRDIHAYGILV